MAGRLQDVILRGVAAARPLATAVAPGTLYYSTDTATTDRSDGTNWQTYADATSVSTAIRQSAPFFQDLEDPIYEIPMPGIPGSRGPQGIQGPAGIGGSSSGVSFPFFPEAEDHPYEQQIPIPGPSGPVGAAGSITTAQKTRQITIVVDGGGVALTTGIKGYKSFPVAGTITGVRLLADQSGSIVIDIWKDTYANYPPTVADTITAAAKPTIITALKSEDTTLTGWTLSVSAGDVFGFNIDSVTTIQRIILELTIVVT